MPGKPCGYWRDGLSEWCWLHPRRSADSLRKLHVRIQQSAWLRLDTRNRECLSCWCDYQFGIWDELQVTTFHALVMRASDVYQIAELLLS